MGNICAKGAASAALCLALFGCVDDGVVESSPDPASTPGLDDDFAAAARAQDLPVDLLEAIAYIETRWQMVIGESEHEGRPAGAGVFALWGDNLAIGAVAAGVSEETARMEVTANIAAAAARLAGLAETHGIAGDDLLAWQPVIAEFSQSDDPDVRAAYASDVLDALATGATEVAEDGTVIATFDAHPELGTRHSAQGRGAIGDYADAIWRASPNYSSRGGSAVSLVVIHTCEGAYSGCWGWLKNSSSGVSAHYVVKENGSEITQLVREASKAWHVAASYQCARAGNTQCTKNGVSTNTFSVGIEHAGFASQSSFPVGQIEASAKLTCDITRDQGVPRDRNHIVSHGQLQPSNRIDPGPNWPWAHYIDRVRAHCGEGGGGGGGSVPTGSIIIDSNNANNNQSVGKIELAGTWTSSTSTAGYYGSGYWTANAQATSAPATFWFYLPTAQTRSIDAWWTGGSNRATEAPFIAFNAAGTEVGRKIANQQATTSQWVTLGTWSFSAGWNKVVLSRWADAGKVVIADAVRVR